MEKRPSSLLYVWIAVIHAKCLTSRVKRQPSSNRRMTHQIETRLAAQYNDNYRHTYRRLNGVIEPASAYFRSQQRPAIDRAY
jgi:hypothetical protein